MAQPNSVQNQNGIPLVATPKPVEKPKQGVVSKVTGAVGGLLGSIFMSKPMVKSGVTGALATWAISEIPAEVLSELEARAASLCSSESSLVDFISAVSPAILPCVSQNQSNPNVQRLVKDLSGADKVAEVIKCVLLQALVNLSEDIKKVDAQGKVIQPTFTDVIAHVTHLLSIEYNKEYRDQHNVSFRHRLGQFEDQVRIAKEKHDKADKNNKKAAKQQLELAINQRNDIIALLFTPLFNKMFPKGADDLPIPGAGVVWGLLTDPALLAGLYYRLMDTQQEIAAREKEQASDPLYAVSKAIIAKMREKLAIKPESCTTSALSSQPGKVPSKSTPVNFHKETEMKLVVSEQTVQQGDRTTVAVQVQAEFKQQAELSTQASLTSPMAREGEPDLKQNREQENKILDALETSPEQARWIESSKLDFMLEGTKNSTLADTCAIAMRNWAVGVHKVNFGIAADAEVPLPKDEWESVELSTWEKLLPIVHPWKQGLTTIPNILQDLASSKNPDLDRLWNLFGDRIYSILSNAVRRMPGSQQAKETEPVAVAVNNLWTLFGEFYGTHKGILNALKGSTAKKRLEQGDKFLFNGSDVEMTQDICKKFAERLCKLTSLEDVIRIKLLSDPAKTPEANDKLPEWVSRLRTETLPNLFFNMLQNNHALLDWVTPEIDVAKLSSSNTPAGEVAVATAQAASRLSFEKLTQQFTGENSPETVRNLILPQLITVLPALKDNEVGQKALVAQISAGLDYVLRNPQAEPFRQFLAANIQHIVLHLLTKPSKTEAEMKQSAANGEAERKYRSQLSLLPTSHVETESLIPFVHRQSSLIWNFFNRHAEKLSGLHAQVKLYDVEISLAKASEPVNQQEVDRLIKLRKKATLKTFKPLAKQLMASLHLDAIAKLKAFGLDNQIKQQLVEQLYNVYVQMEVANGGQQNARTNLRNLVHGTISDAELDKIYTQLGALQIEAKGDAAAKKRELQQRYEARMREILKNADETATQIDNLFTGVVAPYVAGKTQAGVSANAQKLVGLLSGFLVPATEEPGAPSTTSPKEVEADSKDNAARPRTPQPRALSQDVQRTLEQDVQSLDENAAIWQIASQLIGTTLPKVFVNLLQNLDRNPADPLPRTAVVDIVHTISEVSSQFFDGLKGNADVQDLLQRTQKIYAEEAVHQRRIQKLKEQIVEERARHEGEVKGEHPLEREIAAEKDLIAKLREKRLEPEQAKLAPHCVPLAQQLLKFTNNDQDHLLSHLPLPQNVRNLIWGDADVKAQAEQKAEVEGKAEAEVKNVAAQQRIGKAQECVAGLIAKAFIDMHEVDQKTLSNKLSLTYHSEGAVALCHLIGVMTRDRVPYMLAEDTNMSASTVENGLRAVNGAPQSPARDALMAYIKQNRPAIDAFVKANMNAIGLKGIRKQPGEREPGADALWDLVGNQTELISLRAVDGLTDNLTKLQNAGFMKDIISTVLEDVELHMDRLNAVTKEKRKSHLHEVSDDDLQAALENIEYLDRTDPAKKRTIKRNALEPALQQQDLVLPPMDRLSPKNVKQVLVDLVTKMKEQMKKRQVPAEQTDAFKLFQTISGDKELRLDQLSRIPLKDVQPIEKTIAQHAKAIKFYRDCELERRVEKRRMELLYKPLTMKLLKLFKLDSPHMMPGPVESRELVYKTLCEQAPGLVRMMYEKLGSSDSLNGMIISTSENAEEQFLQPYRKLEAEVLETTTKPQVGEKSPEELAEDILVTRWNNILQQVKGAIPSILGKAIELSDTKKIMAKTTIKTINAFDLVKKIANKTIMATVRGMHPGEFVDGDFVPKDVNGPKGKKIDKDDIAFPMATTDKERKAEDALNKTNSDDQAKRAYKTARSAISAAIDKVVQDRKNAVWESVTECRNRTVTAVCGKGRIQRSVIWVSDKIFQLLGLVLNLALLVIGLIPHLLTQYYIGRQLNHVKENMKKPIHEDLVVKVLNRILDGAFAKLEEIEKEEAGKIKPASGSPKLGPKQFGRVGEATPGRNSPPPKAAQPSSEKPKQENPPQTPGGQQPGAAASPADRGIGLGLHLGAGKK